MILLATDSNPRGHDPHPPAPLHGCCRPAPFEETMSRTRRLSTGIPDRFQPLAPKWSAL